MRKIYAIGEWITVLNVPLIHPKMADKHLGKQKISHFKYDIKKKVESDATYNKKFVRW